MLQSTQTVLSHHHIREMDFHNVQDKDMSLVLSSDAKPRLKWTPELHQRFADAVNQLGGPDKATPKSLMRVMGIHGLTLYHLKSHLQKYRLGKSQQSQQAYNQNKQEDYKENHRSHLRPEIFDGAQNQINPSLQIAQTLQMQREVQRKLHEQIEVQRHLQLRIEAQGKYLQSVLKKAQETLARYSASPIEVELAKAELSQLLVSMVDNGCPSSSLSVLTEIEGSFLKDSENKRLTGTGCSLESSLTSSERSGRKEEADPKEEAEEVEKWKRNSTVLSLMEMNPGQENRSDGRGNERKRSRNTIADETCVEQSPGKRSSSHDYGDEKQLRKFNFLETFDLNSKCINDFDTGTKVLDLNCKLI